MIKSNTEIQVLVRIESEPGTLILIVKIAQKQRLNGNSVEAGMKFKAEALAYKLFFKNLVQHYSK